MAFTITTGIDSTTQYSHTPIPFAVNSSDWDSYSDYYWIIVIKKETFNGSGVYEDVLSREFRPDSNGNLVIDVAPVLRGLLYSIPPAFGTVFVLAQVGQNLRYQVSIQEFADGAASSTILSSANMILGADRAWRGWDGGASNPEFDGTARYLTEHPRPKTVFPGQPEYLSCIVADGTHDGVLGIIAEVTWQDDTSDVYGVPFFPSIDGDPGDIVLFSSGYEILDGALSLGSGPPSALDKPVKSWTVYLNSQDGLYGEHMTYILEDCDYSPYLRYIVWRNRMGGYDTIAVKGEVNVNMAVSKQLSTSITDPRNYGTERENISYNSRAFTEMTFHTGWMLNDELDWVRGLLASTEVYLMSDTYYANDAPAGQYMPIEIEAGSTEIHRDEEFLRKFTFKARPAIAQRYL